MARFTKGNGLGNDYLVMEERDIDFPLGTAAVRWICHRNWGVGSDGILLLVPAWAGADFGLRIFNPDGSEAEKSGNGLRIFAKYLWDHGHAKKERFTVETKGGLVECQCHVRDGHVRVVTVEMGRATFRAREIPMTGDGDAVGVPLTLDDGTRITATAVSVGNPHCVVFTDRLDETEVRRLGPMIERHTAFPNRTNVQFARRLGADAIEIMIWERGAGWTLASGTSACGAASAAVRNGHCSHGRLRVQMPGGELAIEVRPDWSLALEGPVELVCTGTLTAEFYACTMASR